MTQRRNFLKLGAGLGALAALPSRAFAAEAPTELRLDFAYYSPASLVLKRQGWVEDTYKAKGTQVRWVQSAGSNRALEYLNAGSVDFGSTAGLAALLARANGNPIKSVYVYSRPEWTALAVAKSSPLKSVPELKGRKVAATKGTDPYLFLLRSLHEFGLKKNDVEIVHLQHADGRVALEQGQVDAWAGLDPHLAASELDAGSRLIYRNVGFNTYGFLNVSEKFAAEHPEDVQTVIRLYERARQWVIANPQETARILAEEAKLSPAVAAYQLKRTDFSRALIGDEHVEALRAAAPILLDEQLVRAGTDANKVIATLVEPRFARGIVSA
ncbi:aliphatic sulfonate ABC transporter substrate-binding protein [Niveibacterium sp. SC-1]|uniref:aliphatic sulfonate ABC transporter substrate-binding protein n=1 Tax=Niveibacterium sp. SC-1 TaxID=3135646 RepID=UPI00311E16EA